MASYTVRRARIEKVVAKPGPIVQGERMPPVLQVVLSAGVDPASVRWLMAHVSDVVDASFATAQLDLELGETAGDRQVDVTRIGLEEAATETG